LWFFGCLNCQPEAAFFSHDFGRGQNIQKLFFAYEVVAVSEGATTNCGYSFSINPDEARPI
jgi:hypothetical protein